ncbi:PH domain-containing protein [Candidatus Saccharibacteria bacterium]|nr:PH domain-containing protein [Candidatus Saccharibacteria bacterium]
MAETKRDRAQKRQFAGQQEGEVVELMTRRFPIVLRKQLIFGLLIILVGMIPWAIATANEYSWQGLADGWLLFGVLALAFYWLRAWVGYYYSIYLLTNKRLMVVTQRGFFNRKVKELALTNIQNVNYEVTGMQAAMFGFGEVEVATLSGAGGLKLKYVHHPADFQQAVLAHVHHGNQVLSTKPEQLYF